MIKFLFFGLLASALFINCSPYLGPIGSSRTSNGLNLAVAVEKNYPDLFGTKRDSLFEAKIYNSIDFQTLAHLEPI